FTWKDNAVRCAVGGYCHFNRAVPPSAPMRAEKARGGEIKVVVVSLMTPEIPADAADHPAAASGSSSKSAQNEASRVGQKVPPSVTLGASASRAATPCVPKAVQRMTSVARARATTALAQSPRIIPR